MDLHTSRRPLGALSPPARAKAARADRHNDAAASAKPRRRQRAALGDITNRGAGSGAGADDAATKRGAGKLQRRTPSLDRREEVDAILDGAAAAQTGAGAVGRVGQGDPIDDVEYMPPPGPTYSELRGEPTIELDDAALNDSDDEPLPPHALPDPLFAFRKVDVPPVPALSSFATHDLDNFLLAGESPEWEPTTFDVASVEALDLDQYLASP